MTDEKKPETWTTVDLNGFGFDNILYDNNAIPMTEVGTDSGQAPSGLPSRPSQTSIPQMALGEDLKPTDGVPIKPSVAKDASHIRWKAVRQLGYAVIRNGLCWLFVSCVVLIALEDISTIKEWLNDGRVSIIVLFILGFVGIPFQAVHAVREIRNRHPSLLMDMLRQTRSIKDFKELVRQRQLSPPYLAVEISLKSGAMARVKRDDNNWMVTTRRNIKVLDFNTWLDISKPIADQRWEQLGTFWIILTKEYRFLDKNVEASTQEEVAQFKRDCDYDKYMYFMKFQYLLDIQEGDYFPDAEACLVYQKTRPLLFNVKAYVVCLCLALDMFYQIVFYVVTKRAQDYCFVKFIDR